MAQKSKFWTQTITLVVDSAWRISWLMKSKWICAVSRMVLKGVCFLFLWVKCRLLVFTSLWGSATCTWKRHGWTVPSPPIPSGSRSYWLRNVHLFWAAFVRLAIVLIFEKWALIEFGNWTCIHACLLQPFYCLFFRLKGIFFIKN
jgi:hypothetical protein